MGKMMKKAISPLSLMLVIALVVVVFAGCSSKKEEAVSAAPASAAATSTSTAEPAATSTPEADPFAEPMEISVAMWGIGDAIPDGFNDAVKDALYKKLNITIKPVNTTWDDYTQKIQVWAASGQLPDLFAIDAVTSPNLKSWVTQGIVHELPADLSAYPHLDELMKTTDFQGYKYPLGDANGKYVSIPRPNFRDANMNANSHGILIRKDWMANVGITKAPETWDEFVALMKAFADNDPDKNGKKDTIGLTSFSPSWLGYLMGSFEPGLMSGASQWVKGDGKWVPAFTTANATAGIKAIKQLYDAGGLDKDFATIKSGEAADKFASGIAGAYVHDVVPGTLANIKNKYEQINPGKKFEDSFMILPPIKALDGNYYRDLESGIWSESYINAKADDKKVDRILRMFDFLFSEEGFNLMHYGIEGVDYTKSGNTITMIDQKDANGKAIALGEKYPIMKVNSFAEWSGTSSANNPVIPLTIRTMSKDNLEYLLANAKPTPTDLRLGFIDYPSRAKAVENFSEDLVKAVLSKDSEKAWNTLISDYLKNGYNTIIEEFNAEATKLGITP